jgi:hypothetical protein
MQIEELLTGIALLPEPLPSKEILEDLDKYHRTGEITKKLLNYTAPFLNDKAESPRCEEVSSGIL